MWRILVDILGDIGHLSDLESGRKRVAPRPPKRRKAPNSKAKEVRAGEPAVTGKVGVATGGGEGVQVGPKVGRGVAVAS